METMYGKVFGSFVFNIRMQELKSLNDNIVLMYNTVEYISAIDSA